MAVFLCGFLFSQPQPQDTFADNILTSHPAVFNKPNSTNLLIEAIYFSSETNANTSHLRVFNDSLNIPTLFRPLTFYNVL